MTIQVHRVIVTGSVLINVSHLALGLPQSKPLSNVCFSLFLSPREGLGEDLCPRGASMIFCFGIFFFFFLQKVRNMALDDVVILNVDTNTLETPFDDLQSLPNDVVGNEWP